MLIFITKLLACASPDKDVRQRTRPNCLPGHSPVTAAGSGLSLSVSVYGVTEDGEVQRSAPRPENPDMHRPKAAAVA
jgi:hypothetical protein